MGWGGVGGGMNGGGGGGGAGCRAVAVAVLLLPPSGPGLFVPWCGRRSASAAAAWPTCWARGGAGLGRLLGCCGLLGSGATLSQDESRLAGGATERLFQARRIISGQNRPEQARSGQNRPKTGLNGVQHAVTATCWARGGAGRLGRLRGLCTWVDETAQNPTRNMKRRKTRIILGTAAPWAVYVG